MTAREAIAALRVRYAEDDVTLAYLDTIEVGMKKDDFILPQAVFDAFVAVYENGYGRTKNAVLKKCAFAHQVWTQKYGDPHLNPAQEEYACALWVWCITSSDNRGMMYSRLDWIVNHESSDAGFKRRATQQETVPFNLEKMLS